MCKYATISFIGVDTLPESKAISKKRHIKLLQFKIFVFPESTGIYGYKYIKFGGNPPCAEFSFKREYAVIEAKFLQRG